MQFAIALLLAPLAAAFPHAALPVRSTYNSHAARHDNSSNSFPPYGYLPGGRTGPKGRYGGPHNYTAAEILRANQVGVAVTDFLVRQTLQDNTLNVIDTELVSFKLNGNTTCEADHPGSAMTNEAFTFPCGTSSPYSFGMVPSNSSGTSFGVRVYKETSSL